MTVFRGEDAIKRFLADLDEWVSGPVDCYLLGGTAMTARGLKDQTEDIDLAIGVTDEFDHIYQVLQDQGFETRNEPTAGFDSVGTTVELHHPNQGVKVDLFERQVVGKVWLTERMRYRADEFWTGEAVTASLVADEDMFLFKAVAGGDIGRGRRRDLEDMRMYAQRGLDYDVIVAEIDAQRPFNTGATEARQIRDRSHPLFAIETAVTSLAGLPAAFTEPITAYGTAFEVEYAILGAVDDGIHDIDRLQTRVLDTVRSLDPSDTDAVIAGIDRLVTKHVLTRGDGTVHLTTSNDTDTTT
jgi:hypothetical protein